MSTGLKGINDRYGHAEGDLVITGAAEVLTTTFRTTDIVARLGGDEFTILTVDDAMIDIAVVKERLQANVEAYNTKKMLRHRLSMSIGSPRAAIRNKAQLSMS